MGNSTLGYRSRTNPLEEIKQCILSHIDSEKIHIFLFGSRATKHADQWSDYDIGLETSDNTTIPISLFLRIQSQISELPRPIDLIDFATVSKRFQQYAKQHYITL